MIVGAFALAHANAQPASHAARQPNEAGVVPILEYHDLVSGRRPTGYQYGVASFRQDMEWLYAHHYRPINLSDYVHGNIDCPKGMSPVIITFDDALLGQFRESADGKIDPNCAVGILNAMHAKHPDWPLRGTFFVLTDARRGLPPPFYQKETAQSKMNYLVKAGYEIGNHTVNHAAGMNHWPDARVESEIGGAIVQIHKYLPDYNVDMLALPFGVYPKNDHLVAHGESHGIAYTNLCAMEAGFQPYLCPMDKRFNAYHIQRIIPGPKQFEIRYWLNYLEKNPAKKFISDGDPTTYTVNAASLTRLNIPRLKNRGFTLRTYGATKPVGKSKKKVA